MRTNMMRVVVAIGACAAAGLTAGCRCGESTAEHASNPALRRIETPANASPADADRAALARFVGTWAFDGWATGRDGEHTTSSGRAAGVIEDEHFVMIDLQATSGQMGGRAGRTSGSMLLASEPGIGLTLTAWGDASPSICRSVGRVEGNASAFTFREARNAGGSRGVRLTITFQTDDRWIAEISDATADAHPVVARYEFTRSAR